MPKEQEPSRYNKVRGGLPGDKWREHVSEGAKRAYDYPLAQQRQDASALRRKGRLVEAHRKEKASYKIRVRGYARKSDGDKQVEKAWTKNVTRIGPYTRSKSRLSLLPKSKAERRNETIRAVGSSLGGIRTVAALGGGAAIGDVVTDKKRQAKEIGLKVKSHVPAKEGTVVKSLTIDDINGNRLPVIRPHYDIDTINKQWSDAEYEAYLDEIAKFSLAPFKSAFRQAAPEAWHAPAENLYRGARQSFQEGGVGGLSSHLGQQAKPWTEKLGQMSTGQKTAAGVGAGAVGLGAAGYGAYRMAKPMLKRKAKKAAIYGAVGLGGTVAAGTALGNAATNR